MWAAGDAVFAAGPAAEPRAAGPGVAAPDAAEYCPEGQLVQDVLA